MTDESLRLVALRRVRLAGRLFLAGQPFHVTGTGRVRCAWGLVSTQQARPADHASRVLVELYALERELAEVTPA